MHKIIQRYLSSYKGLSRESWLLSLVMLINRSGAMVMPFMGIYLHKELGYELSQLGLVLSSYGVGALVGSWIGGELTDRIGSYKTQLLSLLLCAPLYIIIPYFTDIYAISFLLFLLSIVYESFRPANSVAITLFAKKENITRAFSLNRMALNLGFSIGPAIGGVLSAISFHLLFYVNAIACVVAALFLIRFFSTKKHNSISETTSAKEKDLTLKSPYKDTLFLWFTFFCATFSIAFFQLLNTLPLFFEQELKLSQTDIGLLMGYSGFIIVLIEMPLIAFVEKKLSIVQVMVWGTFITGISFYLYSVNHFLFFVYFAISLMSIGEILVLPFMSTITALRSGEASKGAYMGVNGISMGIGLIFSPIIGTFIVEKFNYSVLWTSTFLFLVLTSIGYKWVISKMKEVVKVP